MGRLFALLVLGSFSVQAQVFLESFDNGLDQWSSMRPYSNSSVSVQNGQLGLRNFGGIVTSPSFSYPYTISGTFSNYYQRSIFAVTLRSNGNFTYGSALSYYPDVPSSGGFYGLSILFYAGGYFPNNRVIISTDPDYPYAHWQQSVSMAGDVNFSIFDSGTSLNIEVNGVSLGSFDTTFSRGSMVGLMALESTAYGLNDGILVNDIMIIPEPHSSSLLFFGGAILMAARRFRRI